MPASSSEKRDYYEVLGVTPSVSERDLKKAYRGLAKQLHPDRNPDDPEAEERFKEAAEAYAVLSDPEKRRIYDQFGHQGLNGGAGGGFADIGDIFSQFGDIFGVDFFGGLGGFGRSGGSRGRPDAPQRGASVRTTVRLTLQEAVFGLTKEIELRHPTPCGTCSGSGAKAGGISSCASCGGSGQVAHRRGAFILQTTCPACSGQGSTISAACDDCGGRGEVPNERKVKVTVPAGIAHGQGLRLAGLGQNGRNGGPAGDLLVEVEVEQHEHFHRDGHDLIHELHVSFPQAALGALVDVPSLNPEEDPTHLRVPAGVQPGDTLLIRGAGVPHINGRGRGDMVCVVQVDVPKELTPRARELLEELAQSFD